MGRRRASLGVSELATYADDPGHWAGTGRTRRHRRVLARGRRAHARAATPSAGERLRPVLMGLVVLAVLAVRLYLLGAP